MPPPRGGESKQGLIITLVFFILLSIILGVFVYLGYAGQDEPLAKAKKAEEEKKNIDSDRNWQKFKALLYQAYMGHTPKDLDDLTALRTSYDAKTLGKGSKDYDEVAKLVELLDKNLGWNAAQKKPARTYLDQIKRLEAELKKTQDDLADRDEKIATQAKKINELNGQLTQARADYQTKLNEVKTNLNKDLGTLVNANNQQRKDFGDYAK
ncbi:MAG TPA: hypothetical protein VFA26_07005, partial [Gemmataceae bacterium]|nr:hypothetical protein [Gemmataceae bacterium]